MKQMGIAKKAPSPSQESRIPLQILPITRCTQPGLEEKVEQPITAACVSFGRRPGSWDNWRGSLHSEHGGARLGWEREFELGTGGKRGIERVQSFVALGFRCMLAASGVLNLVSAMGLEQGGSYGTFEAQQGFPQPSAPLVNTSSSGGQQFATYAVPGYPVLENYPGIQQGSGNYQATHRPGPEVQTYYHHFEVIFHRPLPFCGFGFGWFLFVLGFFIAVFPWVIGAGIFLFLRHDYRERTGLMACTIATLVFLFVGGVGFHVHMLHL